MIIGCKASKNDCRLSFRLSDLLRIASKLNVDVQVLTNHLEEEMMCKG